MTVRESLGSDVLVMFYYAVGCSIFAGERTKAELGFSVQNVPAVPGTVTERS